jgi:hypothetical protein
MMPIWQNSTSKKTSREISWEGINFCNKNPDII